MPKSFGKRPIDRLRERERKRKMKATTLKLKLDLQLVLEIFWAWDLTKFVLTHFSFKVVKGKASFHLIHALMLDSIYMAVFGATMSVVMT